MVYSLEGSKFVLLKKRIRYRLKKIQNKLKYLSCSDEKYVQKSFLKQKGRLPDLQNPKTFSEKLLYLKLHYRNPLETLCADKHGVEEYVKACGYPDILKQTYGVYDNANKIDFDTLPQKFFIKCNHRSGFNFLIDRTKYAYDYSHIRKFFNIILKSNYYILGREWCYKNIEPRIICEKCLENKDGSPLADYKFYCFSGEPKYFMVSYGEYEHQVRNHKFDMNLNSIDHFFKAKPTIEASRIKIPENFDKMVEIVHKLCKPFPHVRVDLYNVEGKIYFGELTFYSSGGIVNVQSEEFDREIASWIHLEHYKLDMI